jgi:hypothetical protein
MSPLRRRLLGALALPPLFAAGCVDRDPAIGLELTYEARQPTEVHALLLGEIQTIGARGAWTYVGPDSTKHEAWSMPGSLSPAPREIRARWRYQAIEPDDEATPPTLPEGRAGWRQAQASLALRDRIAPDALELLRSDPKRHRLKLVLIFDRDRLDVRWQVHRWR